MGRHGIVQAPVFAVKGSGLFRLQIRGAFFPVQEAPKEQVHEQLLQAQETRALRKMFWLTISLQIALRFIAEGYTTIWGRPSLLLCKLARA